MQKEIETKADIELLIDRFYGKVLQDEIMAPFFADFDKEHHMPRMVDFWAFLLLDIHGYQGNVIGKHLQMPLKKEHFDLWVEYFNASLDEYFIGEKVIRAKEKVAVLRWTMESKVNK